MNVNFVDCAERFMPVPGILMPVSNAKHNHVSTFAEKPLPTVAVAGILEQRQI